MNIANYMFLNKQNASVLVKFESNVIFKLFSYSFTLNQRTILICYLSKVSDRFLCSSKSFLNFRLPSTRLLIKWFLLKRDVQSKLD